MYSETDHLAPTDVTATLDGILALLAAAGLSDKQIAAVTGRDARRVRVLVDDAAEHPARECSVIDRARMALVARSRH